MRRPPIESHLRRLAGRARGPDLDVRKLFSVFQSSRNKHENQQIGTATH
jgi:hypothetical protein